MVQPLLSEGGAMGRALKLKVEAESSEDSSQLAADIDIKAEIWIFIRAQ